MPTKSSINQAKYDNEHTVRYSIKLNKTTDKDVIKKIEDTATKLKISKQKAIKYLINKSEA